MVKETLKQRKKDEERLLQIAEGSDHGHEEEHHDLGFNKAHVGLFFGIVIMAGSIISIVIFYHSLRSLNNPERAQLTYQISNLVLHILLLVAVIAAGIRLMKLAYSYQRMNTVDDFLLVLSLMAIFIFELFLLLGETVSVSQFTGNIAIPRLSLVGALVTMIQTLVQTLFIMDGLHRYSSTEEHKKKMPGKGLITFLIIANLSMWAYKTFQIKDTGLDRQQEYFGSVAWNLILHINMPLMLFYRFHATVCLADMWHAAYSSEHGH